MHVERDLENLVTKGFPFVARTGVRLLELERGRVKMLMPMTDNQNHVGIMYAGALFTLAEAPGGALWLSSFDTSECYPIVRNLTVDFRRPAKTDVTVVARLDEEVIASASAALAEKGKADFDLHTEMVDASGALVATSKGTYQIRRHGT